MKFVSRFYKLSTESFSYLSKMEMSEWKSVPLNVVIGYADLF